MFEYKKCDSKVARKNITELLKDKIVAFHQVFLSCAKLIGLKLIVLLHSLFITRSQAGKQKAYKISITELSKQTQKFFDEFSVKRR